MSEGNLWVLDRWQVKVRAGDVVCYFPEKIGALRGVHKMQYAIVLDIKMGPPHPNQKTRRQSVPVLSLLLIREPLEGPFRLRRVEIRKSEYLCRLDLADHGHLPWATLMGVVRSRLALKLGIPKLKGREWAAQEIINEFG